MLTTKEITELLNMIKSGQYTVEDALNDIAEAQYGEDVRAAIYGGIYTCYKDGKAGATDLIARSQIAEMLRKGSAGLEVQQGSISIDLTANTLNTYNVVYPEAFSGSAEVLISNNNINVEYSTSGRTAVGFTLNAQSSSDAKADIGWIAIYSDGIALSEISDLRVAYDGSVYSTAGEAVRAQIGNLSEAIDEIRSTSYDVLTTDDFTFTVGGVYNNGLLSQNTRRLRSNMGFAKAGSRITCDAGYLLMVCKYSGKNIETDFIGFQDITTSYTFEQDCYFIAAMKSDPESEFTSSNLADAVKHLHFTIYNTDMRLSLLIESINANQVFNLPYAEYSGYLTISGAVGSDASVTGYITGYCPCQPNDVFIYGGFGAYQAASCCFYNEKQTFIGYIQHDALLGNVEISVPDGAAYVRFCSINNPLYVSKKLANYGSFGETAELRRANVLNGKMLVTAGDSYTEGTWSTNVSYDAALGTRKTYGWHIAKRNGMVFANMGISGSTMALDKDYVNGVDGVTIDSRSPFSLSRYLNVPEDADYLTLWFGINDESHSILGTIDDEDNTTFYGAWNFIFKYYLTNRPFLKIGVIIGTNGGDTYRNAIREVCEKWGYPYLDLNNDKGVPALFTRTGMSATAQNLRREAFGWNQYDAHPSPAAHEWESAIIENFLRTL